MKPAPFEYMAPHSLAEALQALHDHGYDGKLLAGGQSLVPVMNYRLAQPSVIIDLNAVGELETLLLGPNGRISVGAMVRHSHLEYSELVAKKVPLVSEVMPYIAHPQIRNRGTIGGSLAHADPAAELPVVMVALEAQFLLQRQGGERWIRAVDFYHSLFMTALEPDEILTEIALPIMPSHYGFAFLEVARRHGDYAQVGVAAVLGLDERHTCNYARLVYLNVGETPMVASTTSNLLLGETLTPDLLVEAAYLASRQEIDPMGDVHATADYKRHLAAILGRRALKKAADRAVTGTQL